MATYDKPTYKSLTHVSTHPFYSLPQPAPHPAPQLSVRLINHESSEYLLPCLCVASSVTDRKRGPRELRTSKQKTKIDGWSVDCCLLRTASGAVLGIHEKLHIAIEAQSIAMNVALLAAALAVSQSSMYGISYDSALVSIDMTSGKMTNLTIPNPEDLEAQEESAFDGKRSRYYTLNVDKDSGKVELIVWSTAADHKVQTVPLPFKSSLFVGVGETVDGKCCSARCTPALSV
jgi:hypothetical protein